MQALGVWLAILAIFIWSIRYDLGIMDWLYDKGIYKDKLLTEIRRENDSDERQSENNQDNSLSNRA